ncbi:hypothetical protein HK102_011654 [Quaeritorhiza haematococci]|nr:hypothetical protein HK102_011654 [Quaeritorhiza haematococci]
MSSRKSAQKAPAAAVAVDAKQKVSASGKPEELNPKSTEYEFFGPIGCLLFTLMTPGVSLILTALCDDDGCPSPALYTNPLSVLQSVGTKIAVATSQVLASELISFTSPVAVVLGWMAFQYALYLLVPGTWVKGITLRNGDRLDYKINAFRALIVTHVALAGLVYRFGLDPLLWVADHILQIELVVVAFSFLQASLLHMLSFRSRTVLLSLNGNTGNLFHDFWMGRELNPRFGPVDLKYFNELRPGMIGWIVLNYAYAAKQFVKFGGVSNSMGLVLGLEVLYVADALWFEQAILTTMDITTDGFGFMLNCGDLVWVPFNFSLQARYLSLHPTHLTPLTLTLITLFGLLSYYCFRDSNSQKNEFRTNPNSERVKHLKFIETKSGSRLLVSGWWGVARHINYTADWCFGLSWCLTTGFSSPIPYFYVIYFGLLLTHRELRDEHKCRAKYKGDWERYCKIVRWRMVPGVY